MLAETDTKSLIDTLITVASLLAITLVFVVVLWDKERRNSWTVVLYLLVESADALLSVCGLARSLMGLLSFSFSNQIIMLLRVLSTIAPNTLAYFETLLALNLVGVQTIGLDEDHWIFDVLLALIVHGLVVTAAYQFQLSSDADVEYDRKVHLYEVHFTIYDERKAAFTDVQHLNDALIAVMYVIAVCCHFRVALWFARDKRTPWNKIRTMRTRTLIHGLLPYSMLMISCLVRYLPMLSDTQHRFAYASHFYFLIPLVRIVVYAYTL